MKYERINIFLGTLTIAWNQTFTSASNQRHLIACRIKSVHNEC